MCYTMKNMKKKLIAFFYFCLICSISAQVYDIHTVNTVAAKNCLTKAQDAFSSEQWSTALVYAQLGAAYNANLADFPYLIARCYEKLDYSIASQIIYIETACAEHTTWEFYDSNDGKVFCALLYAHTKRYEEALAIIDTLQFQSSDIDYIRLSCYYGLNQQTQALALLDEALDKWAFDFRFPKLFLQNERYATKTATIQRLAEKIIARSYVWETSNPEVLVLLSPFETDIDETVRRLKVFRQMYAPFTKTYTIEDLFVRSYALLLSLNYGLIGEETAIDEFFNMTALFLSPETQKQTRVKGLFGKHLEELCRLVQDPSMRAQIAQNIVTYNNCIFDDEGDGILNTVIMYDNGRPTKALMDTNQDMQLDITVECNFGIPSHITLHNSMVVEYDEYPKVKNVLIANDLYVMRPQDLIFKPILLQPLMLNLFDLQAAYSNLYIITENNVQQSITQTELLQAAVYVDVLLAQSPLTIERVLLNRGVAISSQTMLGDTIIARTQYTNGRIAKKTLDRDADGYYETEQHFERNGNIAQVMVDINRNKKYEYRETYSNTGVIQKYWDENEDGTWEILYTQTDNTISVQWVHPLTKEIVHVSFNGTQPVSVTYLGMSDTLYPNEKSTFYWVGTRPYPTTQAQNIEQEIEQYFNQTVAEVVSYSVNKNGFTIFAVKSGGVIFAQIIE